MFASLAHMPLGHGHSSEVLPWSAQHECSLPPPFLLVSWSVWCWGWGLSPSVYVQSSHSSQVNAEAFDVVTGIVSDVFHTMFMVLLWPEPPALSWVTLLCDPCTPWAWLSPALWPPHSQALTVLCISPLVQTFSPFLSSRALDHGRFPHRTPRCSFWGAQSWEAMQGTLLSKL